MNLPAILEVLYQVIPSRQRRIFSVACEAALDMGKPLNDFTEYSRQLLLRDSGEEGAV